MRGTKKMLRKIYVKRERWCRKYDYGHLLVVGGSEHYSGSPALNALAALRAGVDLVTVVAPRRAADIVASFKPDLISYPLDCKYFSPKNLREVLKLAEGKTAVVIGGGMTRRSEVKEFILKFLEAIDIPCVVDADAIQALAERKEIAKGKEILITPHAYEFLVLSGIEVGNELKRRVEAVKNLARELEVTILLKGHVDVISDGKRVVLNKTGSPLMTKGGTGDTLAGICGCYLARGAKPFEAACCGAFVNGLAGELASKKRDEGVMASDLIEEIPNAVKRALGLN